MQLNLEEEGFLYGQGVFETMRTYDSEIFRLDNHLNRLIKGAKIVGLSLPSKEGLKKLIQLNITKKKAINSRVKLICWLASRLRREASRGQANKETKSAVMIEKLGSLPEYFTATISKIRQNENSPLCGTKSLNYLNFLLAKKFAQKEKFNEAILLNSRGFLCEGSFTNLFFVKRNCLFTPSLDSGCLAGVTRKVILEIAKKNTIRTKEGQFTKDKLLDCGEAFLTSSIIEVMPLIKIGNQIINNGKPGNITNFFQEKYKLEVYKKCYN